MTKDSAENRKYISAILDTFSIPNFYIRKNRPHGHRYGRALGCKDYFTANELAKQCRKKKYDSIHDRYVRDKTFRKSIIEVGCFEQMIKEMDKLASEDHTYKASKEEIEFYRGNWCSTRKWHTLIQYPQGTNLNSKMRCQQCNA